mmetsp:Transcript_16381/g.40841  ORF Transcript_16381/g.40841 Transcript_16381/m.40841 type:complete len:490 (-) Transcript_16381:295-1764(-)
MTSKPSQLRAPLSVETLNEHVLEAEYAVRGEIVGMAQNIAKELEKGKGNYPFDKVVWCNIGNPQILGQKPITYFRQVLSLCEYPELLQHPQVAQLFPIDVIDRARKLVAAIPGGLGAYSESAGAFILRQMVAEAIERRDGVPCNPDDIYMTDGASPAVHYMMDLLLRDEGNDGLMVPIPQYPLYSATLTLYGGRLVRYLLDESRGWGLDVAHLKAQLAAARAQGTIVRGMVVINPGNPTGQCLSYDNLRELIKFAYDEHIVLMADEVYQENVYQDERPFIAAKKVMFDMGEPYRSHVELLSFHTVSKGTAGECGLRGGYVEMTNIHPGTVDEMYKCASINLSPNTMGQIALSVLVNPPKPGDESYEQFAREKSAELASLRRRAHMVTDGFNALEGVSCNFTEGAMYSFPQIRLPPKAIAAAREAGKAPDVFYCLHLLEQTGISTVPGSGFGQEEGTFHLRTTILPREDVMHHFVDKFKAFHAAFMAKYK